MYTLHVHIIYWLLYMVRQICCDRVVISDIYIANLKIYHPSELAQHMAEKH